MNSSRRCLIDDVRPTGLIGWEKATPCSVVPLRKVMNRAFRFSFLQGSRETETTQETVVFTRSALSAYEPQGVLLRGGPPLPRTMAHCFPTVGAWDALPQLISFGGGLSEAAG